MSREIRFRAWRLPDAEHKEGWWIHPSQTRLYLDGTAEHHVWDSEWENESGLKDIVLMQFTGLHDKNGKAIWEGDVVRYKDTSPLVVEWDEKFAQFVTKPSRTIQYFIAGDIEVLGNIYENPELLTPSTMERE